MKQNTQPAPATVEPVVCDGCSPIPVSHLDLDLKTPIQGWPASLANRGIEVVTDDLGRQAISRTDFAGLISERNEAQRRHVEECRRRALETQKKRVVVGVPAVEGATPYQSMLAHTGLVTPDQEFGGRQPPRFLEEQLASARRSHRSGGRPSSGTRNGSPTR